MYKTVLILGEFGHGAIENFYLKGIKKCGLLVSTFDIAEQYIIQKNKSIFTKILNKVSSDIFYKETNRRLITYLDKKQFDIILVFKGMQLFPETVKLLKHHARILANYNGDHPLKYYTPGSGNKNVLHSIPIFDVHFSYSKSITSKLKSAFNKDAYCIPFGYNNDPVNMKFEGPDSFSGRFLFIGAYDEERARYINKLNAEVLDIYGDVKWKSRNYFRPNVKKAYKEKPLYNNEYINAIRLSSGIINLLRQQNIDEDSHNMRTFEVPGYGGLLISERTSEQMEYFQEDKEAVYFESLEELREKLKFLNSNMTLVQSIKQAAFNRSVRSNYSYDHRSQQLLACLKGYF